MFNFFKKKKISKLITTSLGEFEIITDRGETIIEGKYHSRIFGDIKLSFPTSSNNVTEHQIKTFQQIESNWKELKSIVRNDFRIDTIMIPTYKSSDYAVDAEIVLMNDKHNIISAIIIDNKISEILEIE